MKKIAELKFAIDYSQKDSYFLEHLNNMRSAGIIEYTDNDINNGNVSDELFVSVCRAYGIQTDESLNIVEAEAWRQDSL